MRVVLTCCIFLLLVGNVSGQRTEVYFKSEAYRVDKIGKQKLDSLAKVISSKGLSYGLFGYSDTTGSVRYNQILSDKRVKTVHDYLVNKFKLSAPEKSESYGESKSSDTEIAISRKVVVEIYGGKRTELQEFYAQLANEPQTFAINSCRDTVLTGVNGTIVNIPKNAFNISGGCKTIEFQLKEVFKKSEMVMENLTTTANGRILDTQGMLYLNAMSEEDTLELIKDILIMKPTDTIREGVKMFDGARDPHSDEMNWTINNNSVLRNFNLKDFSACPDFLICGGGMSGLACSMSAKDSLEYAKCIRKLLCSLGRCTCGALQGCPFFWCKVNNFFKNLLPTKEALSGVNLFENVPMDSDSLLSIDAIQTIQDAIIEKDKKGQELTKDEKAALALTRKIIQEDSLIKSGTIQREQIVKCYELDSLFLAYGVQTTAALMYAINKPLMDEFGVTTTAALLDTLPKVNLDRIELAYQERKLSYQDYKFYVFNSSSLGWKNLDIFVDIPEREMVTLSVNHQLDENFDCKLVFINRAFVLPAKIVKGKYLYAGVPQKEKAWLVAVKMVDGKPSLAMHEIIVAEQSYDLEFKALTLAELKEKLKILDFEQ